MPLVRTEALTKAFGALTAVNAVTLEVEEGSLHSVIGPNGAGKTTFFNLLTGQLTPTSGRIISRARHRGDAPARRSPPGPRAVFRHEYFPRFLMDNVWWRLRAAEAMRDWRGAARPLPELTEGSASGLADVGSTRRRAGRPADPHGERASSSGHRAGGSSPLLSTSPPPASPGRTQKMVTLVGTIKGRYTSCSSSTR